MERWQKRLIYVAAVIAGLLAFGTVGHMIVSDYPLLDAFYMALTTVTTVGYMEVRPLGPAGRIFNSVFILIGVCAMFLGIGAITQTIVELELGRYFEKRRSRRMIDRLSGHYIVCGFGRVGRGAAEELKRLGETFVVIERNEEKLQRASNSGMLAKLGDATRDDDLRAIGIERAKGLIAALSTDADNTFVILSARTLNPTLHISARAFEEDSEQKLRRAGADAVFAPYTITGARLAQAILRPHVVQFLDFATSTMGLHVGIEQVRVGDRGEYTGKSLAEMQLRRETGVIVVAIRRSDGSMIFNPDAEAKITGGDYLIVIGRTEQLRKLEQLLAEVRV